MGFDAGAGYTCAVDWWALGVPTSDLLDSNVSMTDYQIHFCISYQYHTFIEYISHLRDMVSNCATSPYYIAGTDMLSCLWWLFQLTHIIFPGKNMGCKLFQP